MSNGYLTPFAIANISISTLDREVKQTGADTSGTLAA
jgi:hypothetical protein